MKRIKTIQLLLVLLTATVLMLPMAAGAATSDRTLPASVDIGTALTVSITTNYAGSASINETIPSGFSYVGSTLPDNQVEIVGNTITFTLLIDTSFDYTVIPSNTAGNYVFSGSIIDMSTPPTYTEIGGDDSIDVVDPVDDSVDISATRTLPGASVEPNEEFTVSITADYDGAAASIDETLPAGFSYVSSTLPDGQVDIDGNTITFTLLADTSFDYNVSASDIAADNYVFSGTIEDMAEPPNSAVLGGDDLIDVVEPVDDPVDISATRTLPGASVEPNEEFTVSITADYDGAAASIDETLPAGFSYVSSTLPDGQVDIDGNTITFTLLADTSFDYNVSASDIAADNYVFSGTIEDMAEPPNSAVLGGDDSIDVVMPIVVNNLPLEAGWNFISVPHELEDPSVESILAGVAYNAVSFYDAGMGLWVAVSTFEPLKGYWINVTATEQVILEDSLLPKQSVEKSTPPSVQLFEGWNAVGSNYQSVESAEKVLMSVDESYLKIADKFAVVGLNGEYEDDADGTKHFMMNPYEGYWVLVTQNDDLT